MDDFVVSGSDSDESYTNRKKKSKGRSKSYREDSWDSEVTSEDSYTKKKSAKKKKVAHTKTSNSRPKSKSKYKRYSEDSDVEFESAKVDKKNILDEDEPIIGNRRTRGKRTKYNVILDDSSESEAEKSKGAGKQIQNCIDSTEDEYDAKEEDEISEEDPDEYIDDEDSKEKSEDDSGDINDQVQIYTERTSTHTWSRFVLFILYIKSDIWKYNHFLNALFETY